MARLLGAEPEEIVFTSGGTESNNLAIKGICLRDNFSGGGGHIVTSVIEHPATLMPIRFLERMGVEVSLCPCDRNGLISPDDVEKLLRDATRLVTVMHANNETGVIQPISEIASRCREREIPFHTDSAQTIGKVDATAETLGVDLISIAAHKFYAPKGLSLIHI